jgi:DNA repair protein RecO (recombination protein O)
MIVRTDAVVLRALPFGETSRIVNLFTRERGRLSVIAKGAHVPGSRFGASLQPASYCQTVFYHKPGRGLHTLSEASLIEPMHGIQRDLERLTVALRVVELTNALTHEEEANPFLFNLIVQVLHYLDTSVQTPQNLLAYFHLRMARALGFGPRIEREAVEAIGEQGGFISLASGAVVLAGTEHSRHASRLAIRSFAIFARADVEHVARMIVTDDVLAEVMRLVEAFFRFHTEDAYPSRSTKVIGQLRDVKNAER